ncbi:MAG: hypothetical protein JSR71_07895 [Proteobacteria bacterium]|nr:hypothetical protein [Pseudomonadota bacterium]
MNFTVFITVLSGVLTFVLGQLAVKLVLDPVQELKRTIGQISHALVEHAWVIANPSVPPKETMNETSLLLRKLSSQLHAHLYLVPCYRVTVWLFRLPSQDKLLAAARALIGLSNSLYRVDNQVYKFNAKRIERISDSLGIYLEEDSRWPDEQQ